MGGAMGDWVGPGCPGRCLPRPPSIPSTPVQPEKTAGSAAAPALRSAKSVQPLKPSNFSPPRMNDRPGAALPALAFPMAAAEPLAHLTPLATLYTASAQQDSP